MLDPINLDQSVQFHCDKSQMQLDVIHGYLSRSYWAEGISRELVQKSMEHALCFGAFKQHQQIGFARMITDQATFAYLADVFVLKEFQGQGIGKRLIQFILNHPDLQNLRRILLCTADAHELYRKFGFNEIVSPQNMMAIHKPGIYLQ